MGKNDGSLNKGKFAIANKLLPKMQKMIEKTSPEVADVFEEGDFSDLEFEEEK